MDIGQSTVDAVLSYRKSCVIHAQLVQDGGMNIVDLSGMVAIQWLETPRVTLAIGPATDPAATHPVGKAMRVVVASFVPLG